jgi:hypothetical protein
LDGILLGEGSGPILIGGQKYTRLRAMLQLYVVRSHKNMVEGKGAAVSKKAVCASLEALDVVVPLLFVTN